MSTYLDDSPWRDLVARLEREDTAGHWFCPRCDKPVEREGYWRNALRPLCAACFEEARGRD